MGTRAQSVVSLTSDHFINFWYLLLLLWWELASIINLTLQIIIRKGIGKPCDCGQLQHFNLNQQWLIFSTCLCLSRLLIMTTHFQISSKPNLAQIHNNIYSIFKMNSISTILSNSCSILSYPDLINWEIVKVTNYVLDIIQKN